MLWVSNLFHQYVHIFVNIICNTEWGYSDGFTVVVFSQNFSKFGFLGEARRVLENGYYICRIKILKAAHVYVYELVGYFIVGEKLDLVLDGAINRLHFDFLD